MGPQLPQVLVHRVRQVLQLVGRRRVALLGLTDQLVDLLLQHGDAIEQELNRVIIGQVAVGQLGELGRARYRGEAAVDGGAEV